MNFTMLHPGPPLQGGYASDRRESLWDKVPERSEWGAGEASVGGIRGLRGKLFPTKKPRSRDLASRLRVCVRTTKPYAVLFAQVSAAVLTSK
jgi:hypothetical protein